MFTRMQRPANVNSCKMLLYLLFHSVCCCTTDDQKSCIRMMICHCGAHPQNTPHYKAGVPKNLTAFIPDSSGRKDPYQLG